MLQNQRCLFFGDNPIHDIKIIAELQERVLTNPAPSIFSHILFPITNQQRVMLVIILEQHSQIILQRVQTVIQSRRHLLQIDNFFMEEDQHFLDNDSFGLAHRCPQQFCVLFDAIPVRINQAHSKLPVFLLGVLKPVNKIDIKWFCVQTQKFLKIDDLVEAKWRLAQCIVVIMAFV